MGEAAITNSFPSRLLESDNAAGKHNTTQHNTNQHNTTIWSIAFFVVAEAEKKIYFEEENNHLVTTFAGVNFLDGITQCNCDMDVRSCFSRFFVKLFPYFPTSAFTKIEIKVVGSTMKGGASPWLFSHSISSFEYKVASTTCQEIKKNTFPMRIRLPRGIPICYKKLFFFIRTSCRQFDPVSSAPIFPSTLSPPPSVPSPLSSWWPIVTRVVVVVLEELDSCKWSSGGAGLLQMIIRHPPHPSHLCQDPDSISRTFPEQCVLVFCYKTPYNLFAVGTTQGFQNLIFRCASISWFEFVSQWVSH